MGRRNGQADAMVGEIEAMGRALLCAANAQIAAIRTRRARGALDHKYAAMLSALQQLEETLDEAMHDYLANVSAEPDA